MAPSSSTVVVNLTEPVIFLRNLDSANMRRERRRQRSRAAAERSQSPSNANANGGSAPGRASNNAGPPNSPYVLQAGQGGSLISFTPVAGRGGAGSRSRSQGRSIPTVAAAAAAITGVDRPARSTTRTGAGTFADSRSPSVSRRASPERSSSRPALGRSVLSNGQLAEQLNSLTDGMDSRGRSPGGLQRSTNGAVLDTANADGETAVEENEEESRSIDALRPPAIIRGVLTVTLTKPTRIKKIGVRLKGIAKTEWPEGIGPRRLDTVERTDLVERHLLFFDASETGDTRRSASVMPGTRLDEGLDNYSNRHRSRSRSRTLLDAAAGRGQQRSASFAPMRGSLDSTSAFTASDRRVPMTRSPSSSPGSVQPSPLPIASPTPLEDAPQYSEVSADPRNQHSSHHLSPVRPTQSPRSPSTHSARLTRMSELRGDLNASVASAMNSGANTSDSSAPPSRAASLMLPSDSWLPSQSLGDPFSETVNGLLDSTDSPQSTLDQNGRGRSITPSREPSLQSSPLSSPLTQSTGPPLQEARGSRASNHTSSSLRIETVTAPGRARESSPAASAFRAPSGSRPAPRSQSKSTRFSLSSLLGGNKASSQSRRGTSPDSQGRANGDDGEDRRARSASRGRAQGLKAIKHALIGAATSVVAADDSQSDNHSDDDDDDREDHPRGRVKNVGWQEFKAGTYNYPIFIPIPVSLPPTIHASHGSVKYMIKGFIHRAGALTTNLTSLNEVHIVAAPNEDDLESIESIIVDRMWETQLSYKIVIHCKSAPIGGEIPISIRLHPLSKMRVFRMIVYLEQRHVYYAHEKLITRSSSIKKYEMARIVYDDWKEPLLPIISESPTAILQSPLRDWLISPGSSDSTGVSVLDPMGPWLLEGSVRLPDCSSDLSFSSTNELANITIVHSLKVCLRVERGDNEAMDSKGNRKKFDIIVEAPMNILSCRTALVNQLPTYSQAPTNARELRFNAEGLHPHEMSDAERASGHSRTIPALQHSTTQAAAVPVVSEVHVEESLLASGWTGTAGELPPPAYVA